MPPLGLHLTEKEVKDHNCKNETFKFMRNMISEWFDQDVCLFL